jgi:hypothetical protein
MSTSTPPEDRSEEVLAAMTRAELKALVEEWAAFYGVAPVYLVPRGAPVDMLADTILECQEKRGAHGGTDGRE